VGVFRILHFSNEGVIRRDLDLIVFQFSQPAAFADQLTEVLRNGARTLLAQAIEAEVAPLLGCHADKLTDDGRQCLVRLPLEGPRGADPDPLSQRCLHPRLRGRHWSHCSARTKAGFRPRLSGDSKRPGRTGMYAGASAICPPSVMSTSGPMASMSRHAWRTKPSACSSSSGPRRTARRNSSVSSTVRARAPNPGGSCCST